MRSGKFKQPVSFGSAFRILHAAFYAVFAFAAAAGVGAAQGSTPPISRPDPRFGIVETFVNPAAATEAGVGYTRIILRWDVIQPAGPADWKPANVPDPFIERELADGREVVGLLIGTPAWAPRRWRPSRWTRGCARRAQDGRLGGVRPAHGAAIPRSASTTGSSGTSQMCGSPIIPAARGWAMRRITRACSRQPIAPSKRAILARRSRRPGRPTSGTGRMAGGSPGSVARCARCRP